MVASGCFHLILGNNEVQLNDNVFIVEKVFEIKKFLK